MVSIRDDCEDQNQNAVWIKEVEDLLKSMDIHVNNHDVEGELRFFAGLKRFYKKDNHSKDIKDYGDKRWLRRLCVLKYDDDTPTLSVYKSRKWFWRRKKSTSKGRSKKKFWQDTKNLTPKELNEIVLDDLTPCRVLTLEPFPKDELDNLEQNEGYKPSTDFCKNLIFVKGKDPTKYKYAKLTPFQKWVLSVYDMESDIEVVDDVNNKLKNKGTLDSKWIRATIDTVANRRRLSPGVQFLRQLRKVRPYRDSPVLIRLLEEIREANKE